jgi:exodeoxyribonuclease VIII
METTKKSMEIEYVKDSFSEYLSAKHRISASDIKNFLVSPKYYFYKSFQEERKDDLSQRHFLIGTALHELILEPQFFKDNYIVSPKYDMRTTAGKTSNAEFLLNAQGKTLLNIEEYEMIVKMGESASLNNTFCDLIVDSHRELSCYTTDEKTDLLLRMRPDSFANNKSTITDIKSCQVSSYKSFKGDIYKFGYSISAAFYMDFLKRENYVFCAIEKQAPYQTALYILDDEMVEYGRGQYRMALDLLKWSKDNDYWCSYNEFEILKECYELGNLDEFMDIKDKSEKITIIR